MNDEQRKAWLKGLKSGDRVMVDFCEQPTTHGPIARVSRVTARNVVVKGWPLSSQESSFRKADGKRDKRNSKSVWRTAVLQPLTPDVERELEKMHLVAKLENVDWKRLPFCLLQDIAENVGEAEARREG